MNDSHHHITRRKVQAAKHRRSYSKTLFNLLRPLCFVGLLCVLTFADSAADQGPDSPLSSSDVKNASPSFDRKVVQEEDVCVTRPRPPWPLGPLSKEEREARIKFFTKLYDFRVRVLRGKPDVAGDMTPESCMALLNRIKAFDGVTVLEPNYIDKVPVPPAIAKANPVPTTCPNAASPKSYVLSDGLIADALPEFDKLPDAEKARRASFYTEATANAEYYDFSRYLGADIWGYLGEGVIVKGGYREKKENKMCDYLKYLTQTLAQTFNARTCRTSTHRTTLHLTRHGGNPHRYRDVLKVYVVR